VIEGVQTNLGLHAELMADPGFANGGVNTGYFSRLWERPNESRAAGVGR
jgi:biotin carboxylase